MNKDDDVSIQTHRIVNVLEPGLAAQLQDYRMRLSAINSGYPVLTDWHPVIPEGWGEFPLAPVQQATIYRGNAETWAYSHHQTITKFGDKYVASWSNGFRHEDYVGQEVHCAWSTDGLDWSEPCVVAPTPVESGMVRNNAGLYASDGHLYCYVGVAKDFGREATAPGMGGLNEQHIHLDVYETTDLAEWTHHENICDNVYLFEAPRVAQDGKLMCCGFDLMDHHGMVLIWDDASQPAARP